MKKIHYLNIEILISTMMLLTIALFAFSQKTLINDFLPMACLMMLGVVGGFILPNILLTWCILFSIVIGASTMMIGIIYLPIIERIILIFVFPVYGLLTLNLKYLIGVRFSALSDRNNVINYIEHVSSVTKLKNRENAVNNYRHYWQAFERIKSNQLAFSITCINWAHSEQYRQINSQAYINTLKQIADCLKKIRMPSENIYYLDDGNFLIISPIFDKLTCDKLTQLTKKQLAEIQFNDANIKHTLQYKFAFEYISNKNKQQFANFDKVERNLKRQLEADIIKEYQ
ncbi:hypothetical protein [Liquorilactobacillus vini]|uniref:GGDEF domain-containing protein n=1 Tax=Liquorilactobacillus vini DSM 20605 TaxID=1133569 RepID=A0A0R2CCP1_9LACO|nr:hypothetical protein [Liquorilactobacillus vini]KRM89480.1 hypothetical protein FD21_GL001336 [Liquorilactobacillus vini DSM 20605]